LPLAVITTKKKIQGRKPSKDEDQDMDIDYGNKEDEEALAAGMESDACERNLRLVVAHSTVDLYRN
jgi:hypothetical protein